MAARAGGKKLRLFRFARHAGPDSAPNRPQHQESHKAEHQRADHSDGRTLRRLYPGKKLLDVLLHLRIRAAGADAAENLVHHAAARHEQEFNRDYQRKRQKANGSSQYTEARSHPCGDR